MRPRTAEMIRCAAAVVACGSMGGCDLDLTSRLDGHPEVAEVSLFGGGGDPLASSLVTLAPDKPDTLRIEFVDGRDRTIDLSEEGHTVSLIWIPSGAITSQPIADQPFTHEVEVQRICDGPMGLSIGYGHDGRSDERIFGPFPVEVSPQIISAAIVDLEGVELTPEVRLPWDTLVQFEVRFYDCDGELTTGLEQDHEVSLFFSTADLVHGWPIPGDGFRFEVIARDRPGTEGHMSIGIRRIPDGEFQIFGLFPVFID